MRPFRVGQVEDRNNAVSWVADHPDCWKRWKEARIAERYLRTYSYEVRVVDPLTRRFMDAVDEYMALESPTSFENVSMHVAVLWALETVPSVFEDGYAGYALVDPEVRSRWIISRALS